MQSTYPENHIEIGSGESILLLTDGVFDAKDVSGRRLGLEKILEAVRDFAGEENIVQMMADYVDNFSRGVERADDLTLVEVYRKE
jgi:serine phosphatase RsbU (regulator of sigma subunit)